jgi:poly(3-hydroxybutyrate) depolymerase
MALRVGCGITRDLDSPGSSSVRSLIAGVGSWSGRLYGDLSTGDVVNPSCAPLTSHPISMVNEVGTSDTVPEAGNCTGGGSGVCSSSVTATLLPYITTLSCGSGVASTPTNETATTYTGCLGSRAIQRFKVTGAGHYPASDNILGTGGTATQIYDFLRAN